MHQGWSSIKKLWRCLRRVSKKSQGCSDDLHFSESLWFLMFQSQTCRYAQYQCIDLLLVFLPGFCESITHPAGPSLKFSGGHYFLWGLATKIWLHGLRKPEISEISISRSQQLGRHAILGTYGNHGLYDWHGLTDDIWWCLGCVLLMFFSCHKETIRNPSIVSGEVGEEAHHRLLQVGFPGSAAKRRRGRRGGQPAVGFHGISQLCFWQFLCGLTILTWDVYGDNPYLITVVRIIF